MEEKGEIANLQDFLKLSSEDRRDAIREGRYQVPLRTTPERKEFDRLAFTDPPKETAPVTVADTQEPSAKEPASTPEPAVEIKFKTLEEAAKAADEAIRKAEERDALILKQQEIINKINSTASGNGRKVAELERQLAEIGKNAPPKEEVVTDLNIPEYPDPAKYADDGGELSESYQKEVAKYLKSTAPLLKEIANLRKELSSVKPRIDEVTNYVAESKNNATNQAAKNVQDMINTTINELQKDLNLTTNYPWEKIDQNARILGDRNSSKEQKEAAQAFLNMVPDSDKNNFAKLGEAAKLAYDFSEPIAKPRFDIKSRQFRGVLEDNGFVLTEKPPEKPKIDLVDLHQKQTNGTTGIDPARLGQDENLSGPTTTEEKTKRLRELLKIVHDNPSKDTNEYKEYIKLGSELGYRGHS